MQANLILFEEGQDRIELSKQKQEEDQLQQREQPSLIAYLYSPSPSNEQSAFSIQTMEFTLMQTSRTEYMLVPMQVIIAFQKQTHSVFFFECSFFLCRFWS